jgi:hypothetical protein
MVLLHEALNICKRGNLLLHMARLLAYLVAKNLIKLLDEVEK